MAVKHGLGRGFESLIPTDLGDSFDATGAYDPTAVQDQQISQQRVIALSELQVDPNQPRTVFDPEALTELAASIKEHGVIQPLVVTPLNTAKSQGAQYQIVAGERRYRAAKQAGLNEVPVIIRSVSGQNRLELSLIENIQRRDLTPIETAVAYAKLRDQFNVTPENIAQRVHKSVSAVTNTMRLLKLPAVAQAALAEGALTEGQARPLIGQDESVLASLVPRIISEGWSARKIEQYMVNQKQRSNEQEEAGASAEADAQNEIALQHEARIQPLRERLGAKVNVQVNRKGSGKIVIPFKDAEDFERLQHLLGK